MNLTTFVFAFEFVFLSQLKFVLDFTLKVINIHFSKKFKTKIGKMFFSNFPQKEKCLLGQQQKKNCFHLSLFRLKKFRIIGKVYFSHPQSTMAGLLSWNLFSTKLKRGEKCLKLVPMEMSSFLITSDKLRNLRLLYDLLSAGMLPFSNRSKYSSEYPLYGILLLLRLWWWWLFVSSWSSRDIAVKTRRRLLVINIVILFS